MHERGVCDLDKEQEAYFNGSKNGNEHKSIYIATLTLKSSIMVWNSVFSERCLGEPSLSYN